MSTATTLVIQNLLGPKDVKVTIISPADPKKIVDKHDNVVIIKKGTQELMDVDKSQSLMIEEVDPVLPVAVK